MVSGDLAAKLSCRYSVQQVPFQLVGPAHVGTALAGGVALQAIDDGVHADVVLRLHVEKLAPGHLPGRPPHSGQLDVHR